MSTVWSSARSFGLKCRNTAIVGLITMSLLMGTVCVPAQAGGTSSNNPTDTSSNDQTNKGCGTGNGCPEASVALALASLRVSDRPVGYTPPVGPEVRLHLTYNQLDTAQPATPTYSNLGPLWTTDWLAFVSDNPQSIGGNVTIALPGGGSSTYSGYTSSGTGGTYAPEERTGAVVTVVSASPITYERRMPDGSKQVYAQSDGSTAGSRHVFLTKIMDKFGNALTLGYDEKLRLTTVTDAIGQVTTLQYTSPSNPLLLSGVTDPFGRKATLVYDANGRLSALTDAIGMHSTFAYDASNSMTSMTTPYGTTSFTSWFDPAGANHRYVEITDPLHHTTHVEFMHAAPGIPFSETLTPNGMNLFNSYISYRNTYVWDGSAYAHAKGDYTQAMIYHWLHDQDTSITAGVLESIKAPLENRIWYNYPGQNWGGGIGSYDRPSLIGRVLPDGTTQLSSITYNAAGNPTSYSDPLGRQTNQTYDSTAGIDLLTQTQKTALGQDTLATLSYNTQHEPVSVQDAGGSTSTLTYNAKGQPLTVKNALGQETMNTYDDKGYLTMVTDANHKIVQTRTYDRVGRLESTTDSEGWKTTYLYDDLDRVTKETYPDGTSHSIVWDKLDMGSETDRLGRTTVYKHDAARNLTSVTDPLGRVTAYSYDEANRLATLTDPLGNITTWSRDIQGRVIAKTLSDGTKSVLTYDTAGRLATRTDALGQVATYAYAIDNHLIGITYSHTVNPTPNTTFTWDVSYPRLLSMSGGNGGTRYTYVPAGTAGAEQLQSEIGPDGASDTIAYTYDALGRRLSETIAGVTESVTYDALGRTIDDQNALGHFSAAYLGETNQMVSTVLANSPIKSDYAYESNSGDRRLKSITETALNLAYTTDDENNIVTKTESNAGEGYSYDAANRLTGVHQVIGGNCTSYASAWGTTRHCVNDTQGSSTGSTLQGTRQASSKSMWGGPVTANASRYGYDAADNLLSVTGPGAFTAKADTTNQLTDLTANGKTATLTYDKAGNLLNDATHEYTWDAENRLLSVKDLTTNLVSVFTYDALGRRVSILDNGTTTQYTWCGENLCAARTATGTVTARYFSQGELQGTTPRYYALDHLGSVRALLDVTGAVKGSATYDAYGRMTLTGETPSFGYAGMFYHKASGLNLTQYRAYSPSVGRWISRDPIGEMGGMNLYGYVGGDPVGYRDQRGLDEIIWTPGPGRTIWDGPRNGNWGGKNWSGGIGGGAIGDAPPTDSADAAYMRHDLCYASSADTGCPSKAFCDDSLLSELLDLPSDTRDWPMPPRPGTEFDTKLYLYGAVLGIYLGIF